MKVGRCAALLSGSNHDLRREIMLCGRKQRHLDLNPSSDDGPGAVFGVLSKSLKASDSEAKSDQFSKKTGLCMLRSFISDNVGRAEGE